MNIQGQWLGNIEAYCKAEQDNDYLYYWFMKSEVGCYLWNNNDINAVFKRFKPLLTNGLYIKGNYIFFTLNGAKYFHQISVFTDEWRYIEKITQELSQIIGVEDVAYLYGELD